MSGPERKIEQLLGRMVREAGGQSIKLAPTVAGLPDRLVLFPGGRVYLVELKAPGGRVRPVQQVWHDRARSMGHEVEILWSEDQVKSWIDHVTRFTSSGVDSESKT